MKLLIKLAFLLSYNVINVSAIEFSNIITSNGSCEDTESITREESIKTLKIWNCHNIFPLKPAVYSFEINHLILIENEIKELTKEEFNELITVKNLEIIMNNVRKMEENAFESLKSLTNLTIVEPDLKLKNLILSNDCKLETLHLELQSFDYEMVSKLPKEIRNVTIISTPALPLSNEFSIPNNLINLKYLRVSNCAMAKWNQSDSIFSALEYLDLSQNELKEIPLISEQYPKLLTLILSYNRISSIVEAAFDSLSSLEILELDNNKIHFVHLNAFSNNMNLAAVDLSHNRLKHISLNYTNFHKYHVDVKFNQISCSDLRFVPSYFEIDAIECIRKLFMVIYISSILFSLCVSIVLVSFMYCKWYQIRQLLQNRGQLRPQQRIRHENVSEPADPLILSFSTPFYFQGLQIRDPQLRRHHSLTYIKSSNAISDEKI